MEPSAREGDGESIAALREAAPDGDDAVARRARALIEARLFGGPMPEAEGPEVFGRYRIEAKIGAGGMGVVYRAHDPELDRRVAVKLLRAEAADDERARQRMLREARAMARLAHPNVIHVYDVGAVDEQVFVAMELVDGVSLARWLGREARGWEEVLAVFRAAGEGLGAAHDAGLIHRDFKPENVLVGADGRVRVLDFGLARSAGGGAEPGTLEVREDADVDADADASAGAGEATSGGDLGLGASLTRTGALMGTPRYMSPEVCQGRPADARSDLFAFCVALYEGLYGRMPFAGDDVQSYLAAVAEGELREPPAGTDVPPWIWPVLRRGLERDPDARYPDMRALLAALAGPGAGARSPASGRRWGLGLALGLGAVALALGITWRFGQVESPALAASGVSGGAEGEAVAGGGATTSSQAGEVAALADAAREGEAKGAPEVEAPASTGASTGPAGAGGATTRAHEEPARTSPRRRDWCYMDEDRYLLLSRMPRRRTHIRDREGRCHACRVETRPARVARFQPDDCAHYQVCGPAADEACG